MWCDPSDAASWAFMKVSPPALWATRKKGSVMGWTAPPADLNQVAPVVNKKVVVFSPMIPMQGARWGRAAAHRPPTSDDQAAREPAIVPSLRFRVA